MVIFIFGTQVQETLDMGVDLAASDFIASWFGEICAPETSEYRAYGHDRTSQCGTTFDEIVARYITEVEIGGLECVTSFFMPCHTHTGGGKQCNQVFDIAYFRHI